MAQKNGLLNVDILQGTGRNVVNDGASANLAKGSASSLMSKMFASEADAKGNFKSLLGADTADKFLKSKQLLGLGAASTGISTAAGIFDTDREAKHASRELESQFANASMLSGERAEFQKEQSALNFEQAKELGAMAHVQRLEFQEKQFDNSMEMLAKRSGFQIEQLKNNAQLSQSVRQVNELNTLLATANSFRGAEAEDGQTFLRDPSTGAVI
jgi:hypothetical protein